MTTKRWLRESNSTPLKRMPERVTAAYDGADTGFPIRGAGGGITMAFSGCAAGFSATGGVDVEHAAPAIAVANMPRIRNRIRMPIALTCWRCRDKSV